MCMVSNKDNNGGTVCSMIEVGCGSGGRVAVFMVVVVVVVDI